MRRTAGLFLLAIFMLAPLTSMAQWQPDLRLTDNEADSITPFDNAHCVAAVGSMIHVVWHDARDGNTEVYYKQSTDGGATWGADMRLTNDPSWSERPSLAVYGSVIHVAWYDGRLGPPRIFYKRSLDNGTTWGPDVSLTPTTGVGYHPSIAVSGSTVHIAWTDMSAGPQIYYTRSLDGGATWDAARNITPDAPAAGKNLASIAVFGSIVHVTWMDTRSGPQIYYTRSLDNGATWEPGQSITPMPSEFASVGAAGAIVHVVYADFRDGVNGPQIWYTRSLDNGIHWEAAVPLAQAFSSWYPSIAVSGLHVSAVWPDNRNGDPSDIYYKESLDGGATWGEDVNLTNNPSESREPSVVISGTAVHVVWYDNRDGNAEIYYKHGPRSQPVSGRARPLITLGDAVVDQNRNPASATPGLLSVWPNPSAGAVVVRYNLPSAGSVMLEVFDPSGALVRCCTQEARPAGSHEVRWDGRDEAGRPVSSGVYMTRIETGGRVMTGRVVLAR